MSNPVPAIPAKDSHWTQMLVSGAVGAGTRSGALAGAKDEAREEATPVQLEQAVRQVNSALAMREVGMQFEVDKDTDKLIVKVIDRTSGEVIRQIPNEDVLRIAKLMSEGKGLLVDHAA